MLLDESMATDQEAFHQNMTCTRLACDPSPHCIMEHRKVCLHEVADITIRTETVDDEVLGCEVAVGTFVQDASNILNDAARRSAASNILKYL